MRKIFLFPVIAFIGCNSTGPVAKTAAIDEEKEKTAIMKVIEAETDFFYRRDYEGWKNTFSHSDYVFQGWNNSDGSFDAKTGWKDVDQKIASYIMNNPVKAGTSSHPRVKRKNLITHFFSDKLAYLAWDQYNSDQNVKTYTYSKDQRIMEKENGEWKIVNVSSYWDYKNQIPVDSLQ